MTLAETPWKPEATAMGFETESQMLVELYEVKRWSIKQIATCLGKSTGSVRRRLRVNGVIMRRRGGPGPRAGCRRLIGVSDTELFDTVQVELARRYGVAPATVSLERRRRREHAILRDSAGGVDPTTIKDQTSKSAVDDGSGSVSE